MYCVLFFRQMVVVWWVWVYQPLYKDVAVEWPLVLVIITILSITLSFIFDELLSSIWHILFHLFIPHFDHRILLVCPPGTQIYLNIKKYTSFIKSLLLLLPDFLDLWKKFYIDIYTSSSSTQNLSMWPQTKIIGLKNSYMWFVICR